MDQLCNAYWTVAIGAIMVVVYINVAVVDVVVYVVMLHCGNRWCRIWWTMRGRMCKD